MRRAFPPRHRIFYPTLLCGILAATLAVAASGPLPARLGRADIVVEGSVTSTAEVAEGRLRAAEIRVTRVLRGPAIKDGNLRVIEERPLASLPPTLAQGDEVVLALRRKARSSLLDQYLGGRPYLELVDGRGGALHAADASERAAAGTLAADWLAWSAASDLSPDERQTAERALLLRTLALSDRAAAADAARALGGTSPPGATAGPEDAAALVALAAHLAADDTTEGELRAFVVLAGQSRHASLVAPLEAVPERRPRLAVEAWDALAAFAAAPNERALRRALASVKPDLRQAAATRLWSSGTPSGRQLAREAARADASPRVRIALVELLAKSPDSADAAVVEDRFRADADPAVREAAARALLERADDIAAAAFARVAFEGESAEQMRAVALLRALGRKQDEATIERIGRDHPDARVRDLAQHGLDIHEH